MYKSSFIRYFMTHRRFSNRSTESTLNGIKTVVNVLFIFIWRYSISQVFQSLQNAFIIFSWYKMGHTNCNKCTLLLYGRNNLGHPLLVSIMYYLFGTKESWLISIENRSKS